MNICGFHEFRYYNEIQYIKHLLIIHNYNKKIYRELFQSELGAIYNILLGSLAKQIEKLPQSVVNILHWAAAYLVWSSWSVDNKTVLLWTCTNISI